MQAEDMKNRCQSSVDNKCSEVKDEQNSREGGNDKVVDEEDVIEAPTKKINMAVKIQMRISLE